MNTNSELDGIFVMRTMNGQLISGFDARRVRAAQIQQEQTN